MSYIGPERRASVRQSPLGIEFQLYQVKCRCVDCGWTGHARELKAQACPCCDGRVADDGFPVKAEQ